LLGIAAWTIFSAIVEGDLSIAFISDERELSFQSQKKPA